jgi:hypothetical protein
MIKTNPALSGTCAVASGEHHPETWGHNGTGHTLGKESSVSYCSTSSGRWVRVVRDFLKTLKFGEVHLTVHKGRIIEVRKIEKTRFDEN